jgi:hypothetical protein
MKQFLQNFLCDSNPLPALAVIILFGIIIGLYLSPFLATLTKRAPGDNLPKDVAKYFKDHFKHRWPASAFYPGTESVVHDLKKLKKYLDTMEKYVFNESAEDVATEIKDGNSPGVAFYFGKSYSKHYLQETDALTQEGHKIYRCVPRREYTMFLYPVWYRECVSEFEGRRCRPPRTRGKGRTEELPEKVKVFDLAYVSDPFPKKAETPFSVRVWKFIRDHEGEAFDLGHTNP